ncbi:hypothetical protein [Nostoc sp. TCL240-02]|uniref:hypothetical protein n=1 Tax=Nostoc sp. TCL240-02 TaxID=2572090 RepID=UPI00157FB27D|nr:hypothetical protein [Nostoc sp. TCL240-02]QKQ75670.1 hypothetical protein FBB35_22345 [Nostoc sp. TCL240-02]
MSLTKQELKKRLVGCENIGEINAILQASGMADITEISEEIAQFVETVYALIKQGYPLGQAVEYARSGEIPEPEMDMESLLTTQMQSGADFKNQVEADILHQDVTNGGKQYMQAYFALLPAVINSEAVLNDPGVAASREAATKMILGDRIGAKGQTFLHRVVIGAASKNLLPQSQPVRAALSAGQSDKK